MLTLIIIYIIIFNMKKILIVDDDQYLRELYEEILKDAGYEVLTAVDGEEGVAKVNSTNFDLILLDVMMPKMDGLHVLQTLKASGKIPAIKVILLTNLAHDPIIQEALDQGASSYLIKADVTPDEILECIKKNIG